MECLSFLVSYDFEPTVFIVGFMMSQLILPDPIISILSLNLRMMALKDHYNRVLSYKVAELCPYIYDFINKHFSMVITVIILQEGSDALLVTFALSAAAGLGVLALSEVGL